MEPGPHWPWDNSESCRRATEVSLCVGLAGQQQSEAYRQEEATSYLPPAVSCHISLLLILFVCLF